MFKLYFHLHNFMPNPYLYLPSNLEYDTMLKYILPGNDLEVISFSCMSSGQFKPGKIYTCYRVIL